jgi:hypothetical protein
VVIIAIHYPNAQIAIHVSAKAILRAHYVTAAKTLYHVHSVVIIAIHYPNAQIAIHVSAKAILRAHYVTAAKTLYQPLYRTLYRPLYRPPVGTMVNGT